MGKLLLFIFLLFPAVLFAEEGVTIKTTISISRYVIPDTYLLPVSVSVKLKEEPKVLNILGDVDKKLRSLGFNYKGGSYSVYKVTRWDPVKKRSVFDGFKGNVDYRFYLKDPSLQDKVLSLLAKLQKRYPLEVTVNNPQWIISNDKVSVIKDGLSADLLKRAIGLSSKFGNVIGKKCSLKEVDFVSRPYYPIRYKSLGKGASVSAPIPKRSEQEISVEANVTFICQ